MAAALILAVQAAIIGWILWPLLFETFHGRHQSEREVRPFVGSVQLGQTTEDVARILRDGRTGS